MAGIMMMSLCESLWILAVAKLFCDWILWSVWNLDSSLLGYSHIAETICTSTVENNPGLWMVEGMKGMMVGRGLCSGNGERWTPRCWTRRGRARLSGMEGRNGGSALLGRNQPVATCHDILVRLLTACAHQEFRALTLSLTAQHDLHINRERLPCARSTTVWSGFCLNWRNSACNYRFLFLATTPPLRIICVIITHNQIESFLLHIFYNGPCGAGWSRITSIA